MTELPLHNLFRLGADMEPHEAKALSFELRYNRRLLREPDISELGHLVEAMALRIDQQAQAIKDFKESQVP